MTCRTWNPATPVLCLLPFVCLALAHASEVQGTITDPLGAVVPHATIQLILRGKSVATASADSVGQYRLKCEEAGQASLHVEAPSFATADTPPFYVSGRKETLIRDVSLRIRNLSQQIVVSATGLPTSESQVGASVEVLTPQNLLNRFDVLQSLPATPGLQVTQNGQRGAAALLFVRGGNSNANKVLLDGISINEIGGVVNFGDLTVTGIDSVEVLRGPNSVLYGSDALAGVVNLTTRRGATSLPQVEYSVDGGNFHSYRQEGTLSGLWRRFDYLADFARFDSSNSEPNSAVHNGTFAGNFGLSLTSSNSLRVTVRRTAAAVGSPNALDLFGVPDSAQTSDHQTYIGATYDSQTTSKWHNLLRYGASRLNRHFDKPVAVGITVDGSQFGVPVTIHGANGFTVSGQAFISSSDCCPSTSIETANRDFIYAQTDYRANRHAIFLFGYRYEAERGDSAFRSPEFSSATSVDRRNMSFILQSQGDLKNRVFYTIGGGIEKNAVFGTEATPRLSLAYYPRQSSSGLFRTTKLNFNVGKGIKEPSIFDETSSLFDLLSQQPAGDQLIQKFGVRPVGAERSRSYDFGVSEWLGPRTQVDITFFHNQFTNEIEFVSSNALPALGVPPAVASASGFGATINSADFRSQGAEVEVQYRVSDSLAARGGYTYLDARVERSFSGDALAPAVNPLFPNIPIGAFSPLVGARPFRRAPHTGFLSLIYNHSRFSGLLQGSFVSRRDDSTFLSFSDINFGNTLLLPNRDLDRGYQKLDLSATYRVSRHLSTYIVLENLLSQHYDAAFGFPSLPFTIRSGIRITLGGESF